MEFFSSMLKANDIEWCYAHDMNVFKLSISCEQTPIDGLKLN